MHGGSASGVPPPAGAGAIVVCATWLSQMAVATIVLDVEPLMLESRSAQPRTVGVLVVDDQPLFLDVAREVIEATPGFEAVGEATSGEDGAELAASLRPDLILMDVRMPGLGGVEAARRILADGNAAAVVLISSDPATGAVPAAGELPHVMNKRELRPATLTSLWEHVVAAR
jgi:two-component system, NarL family, invasion response regulator UvrY